MFIPFEDEYREKYFERLRSVFDSGFLSEGPQVREFEERFASFVHIPSLAVCNGGAGLQAVFEYLDVQGREVIVPANTFWATAAAAKRAGARVIFADCNRHDLCLSSHDLRKRITNRTAAVCLVHIGGHIAFEVEEIARLCREKEIPLVEDCAHAHGATLNGRSAGSWGIAGVYSFYATKTLPLGEGGMVVSSDPAVIDWLRLQRNYGKIVRDGNVSFANDHGFNYRMGEVTAALGNVQMDRLPAILAWKRVLAAKYDMIFERRVQLPDGMVSGYYKYIVFDYDLAESTGQVFGKDDMGYSIHARGGSPLPNSEWVAEHHRCVPIWYGWPYAKATAEELAAHLGLSAGATT